MAETKRILMVVTNHDRIDDAHPTGLWLEEFAVPYLEFVRRGYQVTVTSPRGGRAPIDPRSIAQGVPAEWEEARRQLEDTVPLDQVRAGDYDAHLWQGHRRGLPRARGAGGRDARTAGGHLAGV